jgi:two-component system CheB/CheR fusion protein
MKASNEELQSMNEELRSTMEELETSKEELQSMNEELTTLNQENRHKVEELTQLSSDLQNLLSATDIATLFLDRDFRILRFTPRIGELFNIRLADRGRALSNFSHRLGYKKLLDDAREVLDRLAPVEREIEDEDGRFYLTRVLPYRSVKDRIEGVVITFVEITERKRSEEALRESEARFRGPVEPWAQAVWEADATGMMVADSTSWRAYTGQTFEEWLGEGWAQAVHPQDRADALRNWREAVRSGDLVNAEFRVRSPDGGWRWTNVRAAPMRDAGGAIQKWVGLNIDISERKRLEEALRESEAFYRRAVEAGRVGAWYGDLQTGNFHIAPQMAALLGYAPGEQNVSRRQWLAAVHPDDRPAMEAALAGQSEQEARFDLIHRIQLADGTVRRLYSRGAVAREAGGETLRLYGASVDVTALSAAG